MPEARIFGSYTEADRYPMYSFHAHEFDELVLVEQGKSTIITDGHAVQVSAPFAVLYPCGVPHQQINDVSGGYRRCNICFMLDSIREKLPEGSFSNQFFVIGLTDADAQMLKGYVQLILEDGPQETAAFRKQQLLTIVLNELSALLRVHLPEITRSSKSSLINDICIYITQHYSEPLHLDKIARRFFISRSKLIRIFPEVLGMTVGEYILEIRMVNAKIFLRRGVTVTETALRCGFSDVSYFVKVFRRHEGTTPAQFTQISEVPH